MIKKISNGCVHIVQRYLPDPFIFCIILTIVVFIAAIPAAGATPLQVVGFWGTSIWSLLAFSMQMALVLVLGTAMATAPPVKRLLDKIAGVAKTPFSAIVLVTVVGTVASWLNWGFGLVVGALLDRFCILRLRCMACWSVRFYSSDNHRSYRSCYSCYRWCSDRIHRYGQNSSFSMELNCLPDYPDSYAFTEC